jgi:hypothetical protein
MKRDKMPHPFVTGLHQNFSTAPVRSGFNSIKR